MARFDTTKVKATYKGGGDIFSVVGKASTGASADENIQCGMAGKIGKQIVDDVYEFLPLADGDTLADVFFITTPEVNPDESKLENAAIKNYVVATGEVVDAIQAQRGDKFSISLDGIEASGDVLESGYVYLTGGKRKLQYKDTEPTSTEKPIAIGKIESIYNATTGGVVGLGGTTISLNYKMVKFRIIK